MILFKVFSRLPFFHSSILPSFVIPFHDLPLYILPRQRLFSLLLFSPYSSLKSQPRSMSSMKLKLELDSLPYTIHRLPATTAASVYFPLIEDQEWYSITKTREEISLVISHHYNTSNAEDPVLLPDDQHKISSGWRCFKVKGQLDFSLVGIMANLSGALAENAISVFVVSTYDTDYILVKEESALPAKKVFEAIGHSVDVL